MVLGLALLASLRRLRRVYSTLSPVERVAAMTRFSPILLHEGQFQGSEEMVLGVDDTI